MKLTEPRRCQMNRSIWGILAVVAGCGLTLIAAKPMEPEGALVWAGTVADKEFSFAFDLPPGWKSEQAPESEFHEYWIGARGGAFSLTVEPVVYSEPLAYVGDTLRSYAAENLAIRYTWDSDNGSSSASESLVTFKHGHTRAGLQVLEFTFLVHEEDRTGGWDDVDADSTDGSPSTPITSIADSTMFSETDRVVGPSFLVDLGRQHTELAHGRRIVVRLELQPGSGPPAAGTLRAARALVMSMRRI